jgi:hypothetical protein
MTIEVMFLQKENTIEGSNIYTFTEHWDSLDSAIRYASRLRIDIISYRELVLA